MAGSPGKASSLQLLDRTDDMIVETCPIFTSPSPCRAALDLPFFRACARVGWSGVRLELWDDENSIAVTQALDAPIDLPLLRELVHPRTELLRLAVVDEDGASVRSSLWRLEGATLTEICDWAAKLGVAIETPTGEQAALIRRARGISLPLGENEASPSETGEAKMADHVVATPESEA